MADGLQCVEEDDGQGIKERKEQRMSWFSSSKLPLKVHNFTRLASNIHGQLKAVSGQWVVVQSFYVLGTPSTL